MVTGVTGINVLPRRLTDPFMRISRRIPTLLSFTVKHSPFNSENSLNSNQLSDLSIEDGDATLFMALIMEIRRERRQGYHL